MPLGTSREWCSTPVAPCRRLAISGLLLAILFGGPPPSAAQTSFFPYYGKNEVHYDRFDWHIYTTEHFEIYYYPEMEQHLERVAGYLESAYQHLSSELKHDLSSQTQVILFKTHSEFQQQNVIPGAAQEGVGAFVESFRGRMLLPIDDPPDRLYGLIAHELTHSFENDIIPQGLIGRSVPLWVMEGLADYMRGDWVPLDLMQVRDAAVSDSVPRMSSLEGYGSAAPGRLIYNLGHAVFEFIEARWGKEGIRQFLFSLRKSIMGSGDDDAYREAFDLSPDQFDQAFDRYLRDRFKPFRDKQRPSDYGPDLSPNPERTSFTQALSIAPSPSGDLIATVTVNMKDGELDVVLLSSWDGSVITNLTQGFDKDYGFSHLVQMGIDRFAMPWLSWAPDGDRVAYFVRTGKERSLIVQDVVTRRIETRIPMRSVDEPESPAFSRDGRTVAFSALSGGVGDIYSVHLDTGAITNLTSDAFNDYGPTFSLDGTFLTYSARVSGNLKLFRLDLGTGRKTQITFGTHDDAAAQFLDANTIVFASTAINPAEPVPAEVARNGNIYNIWTLDLSTGALRQYTDALGGNVSPVVLDRDSRRIAFVSYDKGDYGIRAFEPGDPLHTAANEDFGSPGPIIDFQAPLTHTFLSDNARRKRSFEKMFLEGRPPVSLGVTNSGDVFGGTQITFGDVLGDQQFGFYADSISQYRTFAFSYLNISRRTQYFLQAHHQSRFFYGALEGVTYDPSLAPLLSRDDAIATRTTWGGIAHVIHPLDRYRRIEVSAGLVQLSESYNDPNLENFIEEAPGAAPVEEIFRNGPLLPINLSFIQETTIFRDFGPLAGSTMRLNYSWSPKIGNSLSRQTFDVDARYYQRLATSGVLALRFKGFRSIGEYPDYMYFGGNSEMRGYEYLEFVGQNALFANAELRFPIIEAALTPIGVVGGVRGVFFFNIGAGWFPNQGFNFWETDTELIQPIIGYERDELGFPIVDPDSGLPVPIYGRERIITGFRLRDARASYGLGLETFALGFPLHFDWSWRTLFNEDWEDVSFGSSALWGQAQFAVWMGYDF